MAYEPATLARARMTLEQLRIFLTVTRHLHFTRAAESLCITQPAVSATIQTLEDEYGVKLFHRIGRHVEITAAGILLRAEAQRILEQVALTERELRELHDLHRGELKLGATTALGNYWLPEKMTEFKRLYPQVAITCTLGNAAEICEGILTGQFDLGWLTEEVNLPLNLSLNAPLKQNLKQDMIGVDRLNIVVGRCHDWFERTSIPLMELTQTSWVLREPGCTMRQQFEQTLRRKDVNLEELQIALVVSSDEMVKAIVENGIGATILSEIMIKKELKLATLRAIPVTAPCSDSCRPSGSLVEINQPIVKLKHRQRYATQLAIAFEQLAGQ